MYVDLSLGWVRIDQSQQSIEILLAGELDHDPAPLRGAVDPNGGVQGVHQPLGPVDERGHAVPLEYAGAQVPKQLNHLGYADSAIQGTFSPDDPELMRRVHEIHEENHEEEAEMFRRLNEANRRDDEENGRI